MYRKCIEDLRAGWYGDGIKEAADYAKLVMHRYEQADCDRPRG